MLALISERKYTNLASEMAPEPVYALLTLPPLNSPRITSMQSRFATYQPKDFLKENFHRPLDSMTAKVNLQQLC